VSAGIFLTRHSKKLNGGIGCGSLEGGLSDMIRFPQPQMEGDSMSGISIVMVTVGNSEEALSIARALVEEQLVACVNIIPRIRSIYRWKGEICDDEEQLLIMKTQSRLFPSLQDRIRKSHSYEVPEIISFPIAEGLPEYLNWVIENTSNSPES
jgi:periplasmic divalent cation tolerance protein